MEQIHDLLAEKETSRLEVKQGPEGSHMPGLTEIRVVGVEQAWTYLKRGQQSRMLAATNMNDSSSRSHCLLCLRVHGRSKMTGGLPRTRNMPFSVACNGCSIMQQLVSQELWTHWKSVPASFAYGLDVDEESQL